MATADTGKITPKREGGARRPRRWLTAAGAGLIVLALGGLALFLTQPDTARRQAEEARARTLSEIASMQSALQVAMARYANVEFLPSRLMLINDTSVYTDRSKLSLPPY